MALTCPRCVEVALEEIEIDQVVVDRCLRCGGLWFDSAEIGAIVGTGPDVRRIDSVVPPDAVADGSFECPHCRGVALRALCHGSGNKEGTVYRCISCIGTWIDRGELRGQEDKRLGEALRAYFGKPDGD